MSSLAIGCSSYVNIPAQPGDLASHNPNMGSVQQVITEALDAVLKQNPIDNKFALLLPEETTAKTYAAVVSKLDKNASWPGNKSRNEISVIEVRKILIRGVEARVDIIQPIDPANPAIEQVVSAKLQWHPFKGWVTQRLHKWRLSLEDAMPLSAQDTRRAGDTLD